MKKMNYLDSVHFYGRVWGVCVGLIIFAFPFALAIIFNAWPNGGQLVQGILAVAPIYWVVGAIEVFTYVPMLGAGSSYLAFVTGNISNLKAPCALNCMDNAGVTAGTEDGEIISTISTAVSSIVTILVIIIGVILIMPLTPVLNSPELQPAFNNIEPALFGALGMVYISKNWKLAIVPCVVMLLVFTLIPGMGGNVGIMVPVGALLTIGLARVFYNKGWLGERGKPQVAVKDSEE